MGAERPVSSRRLGRQREVSRSRCDDRRPLCLRLRCDGRRVLPALGVDAVLPGPLSTAMLQPGRTKPLAVSPGRSKPRAVSQASRPSWGGRHQSNGHEHCGLSPASICELGVRAPPNPRQGGGSQEVSRESTPSGRKSHFRSRARRDLKSIAGRGNTARASTRMFTGSKRVGSRCSVVSWSGTRSRSPMLGCSRAGRSGTETKPRGQPRPVQGLNADDLGHQSRLPAESRKRSCRTRVAAREESHRHRPPRNDLPCQSSSNMETSLSCSSPRDRATSVATP
jgi:hypothetical protein